MPDQRLTDFLQRILRALPSVRQWITALHASNASHQIRASEAGFPELAQWFPRDLLERAQTVATPIMPFPPVSEYGVPEFEAMARMPLAGITWGHMYFVDPAHATAGVHSHELVHVVQWTTLGVDDFLLTYAVMLALHGYDQSPLETVAFEFQANVESGIPAASAVERVERHAIAARDEAMAVFRARGLRVRAEEEPAGPQR